MAFYDDANQMTKEAMDNTLKSMSVMTKGFQQIATESADFAKTSYEKQAAMFEKVAQSKSIEKSIEVQTAYARDAYQDWVSQATRMGEIYSDIAKEAYKPFEATAHKASEMGSKAATATAQNVQKAADSATKKAA